MTSYSEADLRSALSEALESAGLSWDEFIVLGESDELADLSPDLDFAFKNLVPHLEDRPIPA